MGLVMVVWEEEEGRRWRWRRRGGCNHTSHTRGEPDGNIRTQFLCVWSVVRCGVTSSAESRDAATTKPLPLSPFLQLRVVVVLL